MLPWVKNTVKKNSLLDLTDNAYDGNSWNVQKKSSHKLIFISLRIPQHFANPYRVMSRIHITEAEDEPTHRVLLDLLKEYQGLILSCVGPHGSGKLLARSINNSSADFTSSSALLTNALYDINNIVKSLDTAERIASFGFVRCVKYKPA